MAGLFFKVQTGYQNMTQLMQSGNKELKFSFNSINSDWVRLIYVLNFFERKLSKKLQK